MAKNAFYNSLWEKKQEIEIDKELVSEWYKNADFQKASPSLDVFFEIISESVEAVSRGDYTLSISSIRHQGACAFGRFLDMFDSKLSDKVKEFYRMEETLDPNVQFVEYSYLPTLSRTQNVAINPNFHKQLIDLSPGGEFTLSLEDLYVGADNDRLFLTSKSGDVEYYITATNVLSTTIAPEPVKFAYEVSLGKYRISGGWNWENFLGMPYLPRIRYKKMVLSTAKWNVNLKRLGISQKDDMPIIIEKFRMWANTYQMCRYVFICEGDNKLLVDIENEHHLEIIANKLKVSTSLIIAEKLSQSSGEWVVSNLGKHCSEFVLPLLKNQQYAAHAPRINSNTFINISTTDRWRLPGSDWLFAKIYLPQTLQKKFLLDDVNHFISPLVDNKMVSQWFFICYKDERPHLRLRLQGDPGTLYTQVLYLMHD